MENLADLLFTRNLSLRLADVARGEIDPGPFDGRAVGDGLKRAARFIIFPQLLETAEGKT